MKTFNTQSRINPAEINVRGLWGQHLTDSCRNWTLHVEDEVLLSGFRKKPGIQAWIGEHVGKWMCGALDAYQMRGNMELGQKITRVAEELIQLQEPDGYLGTYLPKDRFREGHTLFDLATPSWDVWVHKYCILSLIRYYEVFNREIALQACMKAADLLIEVFGSKSDHDLNQTDQHGGLASGSVLEPIMLLYQKTGKQRYMDFASRIVTYFWELDSGPRIMPVLRSRDPVYFIGNGKAYEMISCFVGLTEYARTTGDREILNMLMDVRDQIAHTMLYPTGGTSAHEWFRAPGELPERANIETCVTFSWMQFNLRLFELTGDPRCLELVEQSAWNQLLPAQHPDGSTWTYHLPTTGPKRFTKRWLQCVDEEISGAPISCCHTNGQRGLTLFPSYFYTMTGADAVSVNFYGDVEATINHPKAGIVRLRQETTYPWVAKIDLFVDSAGDRPVRIALHKPMWAKRFFVDGREIEGRETFHMLAVSGKSVIEIRFESGPGLLALGGEGRGKYSLVHGPILYALEDPPEGFELDATALCLNANDPIGNIEVETKKWPELVVPVARMHEDAVAEFAGFGQLERCKARFCPVLFAGLKNNPTVSGDSTDSGCGVIPQAPKVTLPEYRTMFPCIWDK